MFEHDDFLEVIYEEFSCGGSTESGAFRLVTELAHEGEHGVVCDVLRALVDDGHADVAAELFREVCFGTASSSLFSSQGTATGCMLVGEMLSSGYELQMAELLDELIISEEDCENQDTILVMCKMAELGHEDWVGTLCNHLFKSGSKSLAILLGAMVDHGLVYIASRICMHLVDHGDAFDSKKLASIRTRLLEADHEGCLELHDAMDSQALRGHDLGSDLNLKKASMCGSQQSELSPTVHKTVVTEAY